MLQFSLFPRLMFKENFFNKIFFFPQIEDEGKHGNDDTRMFVLSSLAAHKKTHMTCILCKEMMLVYDRYPLVDGTFFLSPVQHSKECIEVRRWSRNCVEREIKNLHKS